MKYVVFEEWSYVEPFYERCIIRKATKDDEEWDGWNFVSSAGRDGAKFDIYNSLEEFYIELGKTISDGKYYVVQITQSLTSNSFDDIVTYNVTADVAESPTKLTYIYHVDELPKEHKMSFWKRLKYLFTGRF